MLITSVDWLIKVKDMIIYHQNVDYLMINIYLCSRGSEMMSGTS